MGEDRNESRMVWGGRVKGEHGAISGQLPFHEIRPQRENKSDDNCGRHQDAIWGFFMWSLRPASPQPTPQPKCPGDTRERGHGKSVCFLEDMEDGEEEEEEEIRRPEQTKEDKVVSSTAGDGR